MNAPAPALALSLRSPTIVLRGDLDFFGKPALLAKLASAMTSHAVTIDFHDVDFLDASALGCFVHLYAAMRRVNSRPRIRFIGLRPHLVELFRLTHLDSLFEFIAVATAVTTATSSTSPS
jgi:anti-anti-sigma factor